MRVAPKHGDDTKVYSLVVFNGKLYGGTYPGGALLEWNGVDAWVRVAPLYGNLGSIYSLVVLNGKIYGGT
ncbi:unnamed protein product, partial [marine sediment metagenome]